MYYLVEGILVNDLKMSSSEVAQHYNSIEQRPIRERFRSDIIELRQFNNAMKSLMIFTAFKFAKQIPNEERERLRILELGCGKGGDINKYLRDPRVGLIVGVDVADVSIEQCKERFRAKNPEARSVKGYFFVADLTTTDIGPKLKELNCTDPFHIAASQFSIHYSFGSFDHAVSYISNAAKNLLRLGLFIGTYPDGPKLLKLARENSTSGEYKVKDILSVKFDPEHLNHPQPFGTKYHFKLKEVVDCPEFLVHPEVLKKVMCDLGFVQIFDRPFEDHLREASSSLTDGLKVRKIFEDHKGLKFDFDKRIASLDEDMWAVASIYRCFCYRKL